MGRCRFLCNFAGLAALLPSLLACAQLGINRSEQETSAAPKRAFEVFDMLVFKDKPDLTPLGMSPVRGTSVLWGANADTNAVDEATTRRLMQSNKDFNGVFYFDNERWPVCFAADSAVNWPALESVDTILRYIGFGGVTWPDDGSLRESLSLRRSSWFETVGWGQHRRRGISI